jgi:hypothetical protein
MTTRVKIRPRSEWPEDHIPEPGEIAVSVEIMCWPRPRIFGPEFGCCELPLFPVTQLFMADGSTCKPLPGTYVCGHIAEIN